MFLGARGSIAGGTMLIVYLLPRGEMEFLA
jgi:hypothetical protein